MDSPQEVSTHGSVVVDKKDENISLLSPANANLSSSSRSGPNLLNSTPTPTGTRRTVSTHSLLAVNNGVDFRKAPEAESINTFTTAARGSMSMPLPLGKPSNDRRLSIASASIRLPRRSEDSADHTLLATSPPASVNSFDDRQQVTTSPPVPTTATNTTSVTTGSVKNLPGLPILSPPLATAGFLSADLPIMSTQTPAVSTTSSPPMEDAKPSQLPRIESTSAMGSAIFPAQPKLEDLKGESVLPTRAPRQAPLRSGSNNRRLSRTTSKDNSIDEARPMIGKIGVCALDVKARSRPSRQILTRLQSDDEFEVIIFGDKVIQDEDVENWPICDFLISFFSDGFPIEKAISYAKLRKPFLVNDLQMQKILWDRRLCLMILDKMNVPTPRRVAVTRDGGPRLESAELARHVKSVSGVSLTGPEDGMGGGVLRTQVVELIEDGNALLIDGDIIRKPFVEKPVSGEDHNVVIYFPKDHEGGGARKLFRKVGNKSSEYDKDLVVPRCISEPEGSYIYEKFLIVDNAEDVKAYTVGTHYCHAETRKSPVVDGLVRRNTHGKELRYVTKLNDAEKQMASLIAKGFGQRICGFDLLRTGGDSYVIDVNGFSFVKDNEDYYNDCAKILRSMFSEWKFSKSSQSTDLLSPPESAPDAQTQSISSGSHRSALKGLLKKKPSLKKIGHHLSQSHHRHSEVVKSSPRPSPIGAGQDSSMVGDSVTDEHLPSQPTSIPQDLPPPVLNVDPFNSDNTATNDSTQRNETIPLPSSKHSWKLKGVVAVIRHADRTPKQKIKFTAHSPEFVDLLKGHHEEVLLKGEAALASVQAAARKAMENNTEDPEKIRNLSNALNRKAGQSDTKVQIKPMFKKRKDADKQNLVATPQITISEQTIPEHAVAQTPPITIDPVFSETSGFGPSDSVDRIPTRSDSISDNTFSRYAAKEEDLVIDKMQLVMKWGGEPTHSAQYQSQDLGKNMRDDWKLLNRDVLNDVRLFTSSEKRVRTSAQIWAAAFLGQKDIPEEAIQVRKDLLDDSNAAKDVMDKVKKKLKHLLREGNAIPEEFAWPNDVPEPYIVMQNVVDLLKFHRRVMRQNFKRLQGGAAASLAALSSSVDSKDSSISEQVDVNKIQSRWCTGEDADLFRERWEKLFKEFCDSEKADPSKVSELYDTMKYDALHNKQFLEWVFTPSQSILDEVSREEAALSQTGSPDPERQEDSASLLTNHRDSTLSMSSLTSDKHSFSQKLGIRRRSVLTKPPVTPPLMSYEQDANYFKLFPSGDSRSKNQDKKLGRLRELYRYAKILFDYIGPQEYGISNNEKLEIGLLTSLPLLREIVQDLEELQASENSASFIYFTKESHIYTLLNCIMEGGVHTKIKRATIPELDYLSQICFELYEAKDAETDQTSYSIRISISPGCHTVDPLDVSLDSKHAIGTASRRSLTDHQNWQEVISTLKAKFDTVQLPKSFLAINVSEKHEQAARRASEIADKERREVAAEREEIERVESWKQQVVTDTGAVLLNGKVVEGQVQRVGTA